MPLNQNRPFLRNPRFPQYNAQSHDVKEMLGIDAKAKLPAEGKPATWIQGLMVWIEPLKPGPKRHRVMALCPFCQKGMSAGRLHQHTC